MASARDDEDDPEDDMAGRAQQQGTRKRAKGRGQVAQKKGRMKKKTRCVREAQREKEGGEARGRKGQQERKHEKTASTTRQGWGWGDTGRRVQGTGGQQQGKGHARAKGAQGRLLQGWVEKATRHQ